MVVGCVALVIASLFAEIDAPGELPEEDQVGAFDSIAFQRRFIYKRRKGEGGPYVGKEPQFLSHPEQALLRPDLGARVVVEFGMSDGPEEHGVRRGTYLVGLRRVRVSHGVDGRSTRECRDPGDLVVELPGNGVRYFHRLLDHFRSYAVSGQKGYFQFHGIVLWSFVRLCSAFSVWPQWPIRSGRNRGPWS